MASNPMQRQARNYFLLGMVITLLIAGVVVALLFMQTKKVREENEIYNEVVNNVETIFTSEDYNTSSLDSGEDEVIQTEKMTIISKQIAIIRKRMQKSIIKKKQF